MENINQLNNKPMTAKTPRERQLKNYWAVYHPTGAPVLFSIAAYRKDSISQFLECSTLTWSECKKIGWSIHKVNINIKPV